MGAWNAPFRNRAEQLLWQISASLVAGIGLLFATLHFSMEYSTSRCDRFFDRSIAEDETERRYLYDRANGTEVDHIFCISVARLNKLVRCVFKLIPRLDTWITWFLLPIYVAARAYLVIESFSSLFHSPPGVFDQPSFASYFPHIGSG